MKKIKIFFTDFWLGFDMEDNFFINLLRKKYEVEVSEKPDILIFSNYGNQHLKYNCFKVFFTGENVRPNYKDCDFSFSFDYNDKPKNYRLPLYALYNDVNKLAKPKDIDAIIKEKTKFCNFIYSNPKPQERKKFFELLTQYKKVDSAGKVLNNTNLKIPARPQAKWDFISQYKFTIAFENSSYSGYTTEKLFEPMLVNSLPIYWGNPQVHTDFNTKSFINVHEYPSFEAVVEEIIRIDQDDDLYREYLSQPYLAGNKLTENLREENILSQFDYIFNFMKHNKPVSKTFSGILNKNLKIMAPYMKKGIRIISPFK